MTLKELSLYCKSAGGTPGVLRCAIYDSSFNKIAEGVDHITVDNTSLAWRGHGPAMTNALSPEAPTLTGGNDYLIAFSINNTDVTFLTNTGAASSNYNSAADYTEGFPGTSWGDSPGNWIISLRAGVSPADLVLVNHTAASSTADPVNISIPWDVSEGNLLVCMTNQWSDPAYTWHGTDAVTDNKGNTWAKAGSTYSSGNFRVACWWTIVGSGKGGSGMTVSIDVSAAGGDTAHMIYEFAGMAASQTPVVNGSATTGTNPSTGEVAPGAGDFVYLAQLTKSISTDPSAQNWTDEGHLSSGCYSDWSVTIGSGPKTEQWTLASSQYACMAVAFAREAGAAASAAVTGSATGSINEGDVVAGGKDIIITLTGDTFIPA